MDTFFNQVNPFRASFCATFIAHIMLSAALFLSLLSVNYAFAETSHSITQASHTGLQTNILALGPTTSSKSKPIIIKYNLSAEFNDSKQSYYIDLLALALEKTINEGPYQLHAVSLAMPQGRTVKMVEQSKLDIIWTMTSIERESEMQAVYVPLLKGMMGYRIGIIRKGEQAKFDGIDNLKRLKQVRMAQGSDWPDTQILKHSGFNVLPVPGSANQLLNMLPFNRFDFFPRAVHEPWDELPRRDDIALEQNILIKYASPIYFFVSKDNLALAQRIERGLMKAISDGSFDNLFYQHPITQDMLKKARIDERTEFEIANPLLSPTSAALLNETQLWLTDTSVNSDTSSETESSR
ncbi:hypothetical protein EXU30_02485 [Shewanella maritima]|uniref:Transporter substrate-binding domain-containing protein n=1 Tax=Shewanella maritima TaxID=2520507 RepID=A0A411PDU7_9GAMM|nr:hypothetical protein [Shewanella maritima]QBF81684.1 hypothetical protein EXU30_02485 [Shewanella maritima]